MAIKLGRTIGFPTANVRLHRQVNPVKGVYAVKVRLNRRDFNGVANMGKRPTINGTIQLLEVHLFDFLRIFMDKWSKWNSARRFAMR